jgi:predicted Fe-Mo cluster-binding NifX family protein
MIDPLDQFAVSDVLFCRVILTYINPHSRPNRTVFHFYSTVTVMSLPINIVPAYSSVDAGSPTSISEHMRSLRRKESTIKDPIRQPKVLHPVENENLRLLVLENISQEAVRVFQSQGFHVDHHTRSFSEEELIEKIGSYHAIGIRSKTKITQRVLSAASKVGVNFTPPSSSGMLNSNTSH